MSMALLWAARSGRLYQGWRALALAALVLSLSSAWIFYDLGFGLSFLAMGALLASRQQEPGSAETWIASLRGGLAAMLAGLPLSVPLSGGIYPLSLLFNWLALPLAAPALILGAAAMAISAIFPSIASLAYAPATFFHSAILLIASLGTRLDWLLPIPPFSILAAAAYYAAGLSAWLIWRSKA
jgi:predicted membrane metal-binding protein